MKTKKKNHKNNLSKIIVLSAIIVLVGLAAVVYATVQNKNATTTINSSLSDPKKTQPTASSTNNQTDSTTKPTTSNTDNPSTPTTDPSTGLVIVQMVASSDASDTTINIRGGINNAVVYDGTCYAQLSGPNGESIKKDTTLLQNPQTTDCKTVSISKTSLSRGTWRFTLNYSSSTMKGQSNEGSFSI